MASVQPNSDLPPVQVGTPTSAPIPVKNNLKKPRMRVEFAETPVSEEDLSGKADEKCPFTRQPSDALVGAGRFLGSQKSQSLLGLSLYEDDALSMPTMAGYLRSFTHPGPEEEKESRRSAKLGTLIGVYLPTIQHILGVQMFLRLFWIVGISGVVDSFGMVFLCCLCTFLTSISISAIATNGVIESGGAYFMISRNLGPEFGGAVGILYYFANTVGAAMYLIGGVEILLMYIAPSMQLFGTPGHMTEQEMFNNFRAYGTLFLVFEFVIVALGVRFVQFFAPISLACVVMSIFAVYIGAFTASPDASPMICLLGDRLLKASAYLDVNGTAHCDKTVNGSLWSQFCSYDNLTGEAHCEPYFSAHDALYLPGIPGFASGVMSDNAWPSYMGRGDVVPGVLGTPRFEVVQDMSTNFFILLAIFYPSVTGIFTGANMSGDLKDPQKSLPIGTLAAQITTSFIYLSFVLCLGGTIHGALLRDKYGESLRGDMVVALLAWPNKWVLLVGSFTSTFGAALQCLCSAPRLLQSIAKDDVIPFLNAFSAVTKRNEPFKALLVTTVIAELAILIGGIDYISPVVDFFFLMCYCFVNIVCTLQTVLRAPNWRPRFRFYHWSLSLSGAILCLVIMFTTHWYYALVVIVLCASLYKYIEYKGAKKEYGDGIRGFALSTAQYSLLRIEDNSSIHPKNWRPQLLILLKVDETREEANMKMLQLASQLKAGRGLTIVASLIEGDPAQPDDRKYAESVQAKLKNAMAEAKVKGFTNVVLCHHLSENVSTLVQSIGIGGLRPNTIMVGWPHNWKEADPQKNDNYVNFLDAIHRASATDMCLLVPKGLPLFPDPSDRVTGTIDVWWIIHDGGLLILLPFLLRKHKVWRQCKLRVFTVAQLHDNSVKMKADLQRWVYELRIEATVDVVELADSAISAYTYERTLKMEERTKLAAGLQLSARELSVQPQLLADRYHSQSRVSVDARVSNVPGDGTTAVTDSKKEGQVGADGAGTGPGLETVAESDAEKTKSRTTKEGADREAEQDESEEVLNELANQFTFSPAELQSRLSDENRKFQRRFANLDRKKVRKMHTALKLNKAIREKSGDSQLIVVNLPRPPKIRAGLSNYLEYLDVLTEGLERVLLVRGSGKEVITIYS